MSEDDETLNYAKIAGTIPMPSKLEKRTPTEEYHDRICADIHAAWERFSKDRATLYDRYENDWMLRDHESKVRHAQFVLETANLERARMMIVRTMATIRAGQPIAGIVLGGN